MVEAKKAKVKKAKDKVEWQKELTQKEIDLTSECNTLFNNDYNEVKLSDLFNNLSQSIFQKDEYETSEAFKERFKQAMNKFDEPQFVRIDLSPENIKFDADLQTLNFHSDAFGRTTFDKLFNVSASLADKQYTSEEIVYGKPIGFISEAKQVSSYSYQGGNAYGASTDVSVYEEESFGIFQGLTLDTNMNAFTRDNRIKDSVLFFKATPNDAKTLKQKAHAIIVVHPKSPYILKNTDHKAATFSSPYANSDRQKFVTGDMKCLAIVSDHKVLHVQPTL
ncbi:MAG: hypothetical protein ACSHXY_00590 [Alphaproteobacteria bacterium]